MYDIDGEKNRMTYRIFILPQKDQKELAKKRSSLFVTRFAVELPFVILLLSIVVSIVYRSFPLPYFDSDFLLAALVLAYVGTQQSFLFLTARDSDGTTKTQLRPTY